MSEAIFHVTDAAQQRIRAVRESEKADDAALRVRAHEDGASFRYELGFVQREARDDDDQSIEFGDITVLIDPESLPRLTGATLEFVDDLDGTGFKIQNPNRPSLLENPIAARVQRVIDESINPSVASHGGRVSLMDVRDTRIFVQLSGGCQGCGMADVTLKQGIEETILREVPEVTEVLDVTDHGAGSNPYY